MKTRRAGLPLHGDRVAEMLMSEDIGRGLQDVTLHKRSRPGESGINSPGRTCGIVFRQAKGPYESSDRRSGFH